MTDLRAMLAGYWVAHFDPLFVAKPPLPTGPQAQPPVFGSFRPTSAIAYLHLHADGTLTVNVWRNDGFNKANHQTIPGTFTVAVHGLFGIATGEIVLQPNPADPSVKVHIVFIVRDHYELYFTHDRFETTDPTAVAPLTHGVFKRAVTFPGIRPEGGAGQGVPPDKSQG